MTKTKKKNDNDSDEDGDDADDADNSDNNYNNKETIRRIRSGRTRRRRATTMIAIIIRAKMITIIVRKQSGQSKRSGDSSQLFPVEAWGLYHGGRPPSRDDSFHSATAIPPSALDKPSIVKRCHRRRTCSHTSLRRSPTMKRFMILGLLSADGGMTVGL